jgi:hypothetical protein
MALSSPTEISLSFMRTVVAVQMGEETGQDDVAAIA